MKRDRGKVHVASTKMSVESYTNEPVTVSSHNKIVIPKAASQRLGVTDGDKVSFQIMEDRTVLVTEAGKELEGAYITDEVSLSGKRSTTLPQIIRDFLGAYIGDKVSFQIMSDGNVKVEKIREDDAE